MRIGISVGVLVVCGCAAMGGANIPARFDGDRLVDANGMSLYTYDRDVRNEKPVCVDRCLDDWTPLLALPGARRGKAFGVIALNDERRQWTYKGRPLYRFAHDRNPGDTNGHGADNLWRLAN